MRRQPEILKYVGGMLCMLLCVLHGAAPVQAQDPTSTIDRSGAGKDVVPGVYHVELKPGYSPKHVAVQLHDLMALAVMKDVTPPAKAAARATRQAAARATGRATAEDAKLIGRGRALLRAAKAGVRAQTGAASLSLQYPRGVAGPQPKTPAAGFVNAAKRRVRGVKAFHPARPVYLSAGEHIPVGLEAIGADHAQLTGQGVTVGVIDTGLFKHHDLVANVSKIIDCTGYATTQACAPYAQRFGVSRVYDPDEKNTGSANRPGLGLRFVDAGAYRDPEVWRVRKLASGDEWRVLVDGTALPLPAPFIADKVGANRFTGPKGVVLDILRPNPVTSSDYVQGDDFEFCVGCGNDWVGHGTHVAGIIAASAGGAGVRGVAPDAKIVAIRAFDHTGIGSTTDVVAALEWAAARIYNVAPGPQAPPAAAELQILTVDPGAVNGVGWTVTYAGNNAWTVSGDCAAGACPDAQTDQPYTHAASPVHFQVHSNGQTFKDGQSYVFAVRPPHIQIGNLSWGSAIADGGARAALQAALRHGYDQGIIWVASAGNLNLHAETNYPGAWRDLVVTVAGTQWRRRGRVAEYVDWHPGTNYSAEWTDSPTVPPNPPNPREIVTVAAPASPTRSTWPGVRHTAPPARRFGRFYNMSGTSVAAAHVSGVVALFVQQRAKAGLGMPSLTQVKTELTQRGRSVTTKVTSELGQFNGELRLKRIDPDADSVTWTVRCVDPVGSPKVWEVRRGEVIIGAPLPLDNAEFDDLGVAFHITGSNLPAVGDRFRFTVDELYHPRMPGVHGLTAWDY